MSHASFDFGLFGIEQGLSLGQETPRFGVVGLELEHMLQGRHGRRVRPRLGGPLHERGNLLRLLTRPALLLLLAELFGSDRLFDRTGERARVLVPVVEPHGRFGRRLRRREVLRLERRLPARQVRVHLLLDPRRFGGRPRRLDLGRGLRNLRRLPFGRFERPQPGRRRFEVRPVGRRPRLGHPVADPLRARRPFRFFPPANLSQPLGFLPRLFGSDRLTHRSLKRPRALVPAVEPHGRFGRRLRRREVLRLERRLPARQVRVHLLLDPRRFGGRPRRLDLGRGLRNLRRLPFGRFERPQPGRRRFEVRPVGRRPRLGHPVADPLRARRPFRFFPPANLSQPLGFLPRLFGSDRLFDRTGERARVLVPVVEPHGRFGRRLRHREVLRLERRLPARQVRVHFLLDPRRFGGRPRRLDLSYGLRNVRHAAFGRFERAQSGCRRFEVRPLGHGPRFGNALCDSLLACRSLGLFSVPNLGHPSGFRPPFGLRRLGVLAGPLPSRLLGGGSLAIGFGPAPR